MQFDPAKELPIMEHFYTLQGEGQFQGHAAYFIRLAGCDVGCTWCDVKESWEAEDSQLMAIDELIECIVASGTKIAVITGGEPLIYDLSFFTRAIQEKGIRTHVETSGTSPLTGSWDWITFSPKKFKKPLAEYYDQAHELKVIIFNKSDFKWAQDHQKQLNDECELLIQPEWGKRNQYADQMIEFVKANPEWQLSLQTHKYLDIP